MGKKRLIWISMLAAMLLLAMAACSAAAEEAVNLTSSCDIHLSPNRIGAVQITDGKYTSYWESDKAAHPWITIYSEEPMYGLYLCFQLMPEKYEIQWEINDGQGEPAPPADELLPEEDTAEPEPYVDQWVTVIEGDTRYHHIFYPLDGYRYIRIYASAENRTVMGFNEVFVFGAGDIPSWVQQWRPTPEKAKILFVATHPDDDILFLGGAIAWYGVEKQEDVAVAFLTKSNTTRRSEALNGLWTLGIRTYPIFGPFRDNYAQSGKIKDAYKDVGGKSKVQGWVTELYRSLKPEVVVTQDKDGEYGHPQHKMVADACIAAFDLAADPDGFPDTAAQYGVWEVKKLYLHLYGEEADQTRFNWDVPLDSLGGMTANEKAEEAYAQHVTQAGHGWKFRSVLVPFSVAEYGVNRYPNTKFGLYATRVGADQAHDDFLENIE